MQESSTIYNEAFACGFSPIPMNGKIPTCKNWTEKNSTFFLGALEKHTGNFGVRCGKWSNILILDCDKPRANMPNATDGNRDMAKIILNETGLKDPLKLNTVIDQSGSQSYRFYFRYNPNLDYLSKIKNSNIDILGEKKLAVYPGSTYKGCCKSGENKHKCGTDNFSHCLYAGNKYKWIKSPTTQEIMNIPEWLISYITKPKKIDNSGVDDISLKDISMDAEEVFDLIEFLKPERFEDFDTWRDLIWFMTKFGVPRKQIQEISKQAKNYSENATNDIIDGFDSEKNNMTIGTLFHFLKMDMTAKLYKEKTKAYTIDRILTQQIESLFEMKKTKFVTITDIPPKIKYVQDLDFTDNRCLGIRMGLGGGKTTAIIRYVKNLSPDKTIIVLAPRMTYAKNICAEYNRNLSEDKQFIDYISWKKSRNMKHLRFNNRIVISMESLHYLKDITPDFLIVDEINANLVSHTSQETNGKNFNNNIFEFRRFLTESKRIVVADAFLGEKCINFFTDLKINLHILDYKRKLEKRTAVIFNPIDNCIFNSINLIFPDSHERAVQKAKLNILPFINTYLQGGKKLYAFISSKTDLDIVKSHSRLGSEGLFYSGTSLNEIPDDLNSEWGKYNLVATTSSITVGCSHTDEHFDNLLISFSSSSKNYVCDAIQSHYRVRNIKNKKIFVMVKDCQIATNYPVNKRKLKIDFENTEKWYNSKYKGFDKTEPYFKNLILHNQFEHKLSGKASTKMVIRYLQDCNYDIVFKDFEKDKKDDEEDQKDDEDEGDDGDEGDEGDEGEYINIINEYNRIKVDYDTVYRLQTEKCKRKLTEEEKAILDKYWFFKIYTAQNDPHMKEYNLPILALSYSIWKCKFKGDPMLRSMREEKKVLEGKITIEELAEKRFDRHNIAGLHSSDIRKISRIVEICKALGLKHANDTTSIITQNSIDDYFEGNNKEEFSNIQKDFQIEDRRKNKKILSKRHFKGLLQSVFTKSHSMCSLTVNEKTKIKDKKTGKRIEVKNYKLVLTNKNILRNAKIISELSEEKEYEKCNKIVNPAEELYNNLNIEQEDDVKIYKRLLSVN
jgi:hypothetical protein